MATGSATPQWHPASSDERIGLSVGQRSYPWSPVPLQTADGAPPLSDFAQGIVDRVRGQMAFFETQGHHASYGDMLEDVLSSVHVIEGAVRDFRQFIERLAETNLVLEQEGFEHDEFRAQTHHRACREFVEESRVWESLPYPQISAQREASRTMQQHDEEHVGELEALLREFALLVERTLDRLVSQQLVGVVRWGTDTSCDFHFFNTVVIQRLHQRYTVRRELHSRVVHDDRLYTQRETTIEERQRIEGESEYRHARSNIYLRDARVRPIEYVEHRIPKKFADLAQAVPAWLREGTTVIEGQRCSEEILVSTTKKEGFDIQDGPASVWVRSTFTANSPEGWRILNSEYDPALVIGNHYVITGWGPQEEEAAAEEKAEARSKTVHAHRAEHLRGRQRMAQFGGLMLAILGLLLIIFSRQNPRVMLALAGLMALFSLSLVGLACRIGRVLQGDIAWDGVLLGTAKAGSLIVGVYFLVLAIAAGSLPLGAVGGIAIAIAGAMFRYLPVAAPSQ